MKNSGYRKTMAEGEAEWLWKLYGISKPDELILEDIAFARGVIVTEGSLGLAEKTSGNQSDHDDIGSVR